MYRFQPIKHAECRTERGAKMFFLDEFDSVYTTAFYFWLLEGNGRRALVDAGVDLDEGRRFMPDLVQEPSWRPLARLRALGVDPESIDTVIVTHLHFDHLSSTIDHFPRARIVIQRRELDTALAPPHPWLAAFYVPEIVERLASGDLSRRLDVVDGDAEIAPGLGVFCTGGHTPGHQSVLLDGPDGPVCLAGDVALFYRHIEEKKPLGIFWNIAEVLLALERFDRLARGADGAPPALVLPNHDPLLEERFPLPARWETMGARSS